MAEEEKAENQQTEENASSADGAGQKGKSLKGILILAGSVMVYTSVLFGLMFFMGWGPGGSKSAMGKEDGEAEIPEVDLSNFAEEAPLLIPLKEITIYPKSSKGRGPNRITCQIDIVITKKLSEKIKPEGDSSEVLIDLIKKNVRSFFRQLMEEYGVTLADQATKERFTREAKLRLNLVKVDGDQEMQKYLRILRGHVLQVIINELEQSNY